VTKYTTIADAVCVKGQKFGCGIMDDTGLNKVHQQVKVVTGRFIGAHHLFDALIQLRAKQ
jgi:hypothetical protein